MLADIDHKLMKVTLQAADKRKPKPEKSSLKFGKNFSDHMLVIDWDNKKGWAAPEIVPYGPLALDPAASVFHYAIEAFEGMKAYRDKEGNIRLFRPMMNMERLVRSGLRVGLPKFNTTEFLECIKQVVHVDQDWIPEGEGYSLYIRPTYISTFPQVGVTIAQTAKLYVILSPVGPYYSTGWKAVKLMCSEGYCRAFPGGTGYTKIGGNYAISLVPQKEAEEKGYSQVLWLFQDKITEVGTMNFFLVWKLPTGETELITCPLMDDMILPGVTRDSVLALARKWGDIKVSERDYTIQEVVKAAEEGRLLEAFGSGTAAVVSPVKGIAYKGTEYHVPLDPKDPQSAIGPVAKRVYEELMDIQRGVVDHPWSVKI